MSDMFRQVTSGDDQFRRMLDAVQRFAKQPRFVMRDMAAVMENETEKNFAVQGRPKWEDLSEVTKFLRIGGKKGYTKKGGLTKRS